MRKQYLRGLVIILLLSLLLPLMTPVLSADNTQTGTETETGSTGTDATPTPSPTQEPNTVTSEGSEGGGSTENQNGNTNPQPNNEGQSGTEGQPSGTEGQPNGTEGQPSGTEGQPSGTEGQPNGTEGQPNGTEGQPNGTEGTSGAENTVGLTAEEQAELEALAERAQDIADEHTALVNFPVTLPDKPIFGHYGFGVFFGENTYNFIPEANCSEEMYSSFYNHTTKLYIHPLADAKYKYIVYAEGTNKYYYTPDLLQGTVYLELYGTCNMANYASDADSLLEETLGKAVSIPKNVLYDIQANPLNMTTNADYKANMSKCYLLMFKEDATGIDGLVYKIPFDKLDSLLDIRYAQAYEKPETILGTSIAIKSKIKNEDFGTYDGFVATFNYNLNGDAPKLLAIRDPEDGCVATYNFAEKKVTNSSGAIDISVEKVRNGKFKYEFTTVLGNKVVGEFNVTDLTAGTRPEVPDMTEPSVTLSELPKSACVGDIVTIEMKSNIPCYFTFGGTPLNSEPTTSVKVSLTENNTYSYRAVSEGGKRVKGALKVDIFSTPEIENVMTNLVVVFDEEAKLTQTGIEKTILIGFAVVLTIAGCVGVGLNVSKSRRKRG